MIEARVPIGDQPPPRCSACGDTKGAPIAALVSVYHQGPGVTLALCEVCGRDLANAVGFMCLRDGGWSKLEPRKRLPRQEPSAR